MKVERAVRDYFVATRKKAFCSDLPGFCEKNRKPRDER